MSDWKDKIEDTMNDAENKAHELKGKVEQMSTSPNYRHLVRS